MASKSSYMLKRDKDESRRLDFQHDSGNIFHGSIPRQNVRAVADIGTGTGICLNSIAEELIGNGIFTKQGFDECKA